MALNSGREGVMRSKTLRKKLCFDEIVFQIFLKVGMHGEVTIVTDKGPFIFYERGGGGGWWILGSTI